MRDPNVFDLPVAANLVDSGSGATLFAALPHGTPMTADLLRLSVPAQGPDGRRAVRRNLGWTRLGWQPAAPRA